MVVEIEFVNKTDKPVQVWEHNRTLLILPPNDRMFCEIYDWKTSYARWKKVVFDNGRVKLEENPDYVWPYPNMLMLEFLNVDGTASEGLTVAGQTYHSNRGIPSLIPVSHRDVAWAFYAKVERRLVTHKIKEGDYYIRKKVLEDVRTERSRKEIKKIQEQLLDEAIEKTRQELLKQFPKVEEDKNGKAEPTTT